MSHKRRRGRGIWLPPDGVSPAYYTPSAGDRIVLGSDESSVEIAGSLEISGSSFIKSDFHETTFEDQLSDGEAATGEILYYEPGGTTTLTKGRLYFLHTDGTWDETDADAAATGKQLLAIALGTSARTDGMLMRGFIKVPSTEVLNLPGSGASDGLPVYISTTAGHLDFTAPSASGDIVRVVGYCIDDDSSDILLLFRPDNTWVEIAQEKTMPKKDICYVATDALEPFYLKGQIVAIKEPNSIWSAVEKGIKTLPNSEMIYAVKTIMIAAPKLTMKNKKLILTKKNGRNYVDVIDKYRIREGIE